MFKLIGSSLRAMLEDKTDRLGAALAFYAVFSLVPLLLVTFLFAQLALPNEVSKSTILEQIAVYLGEPVSNTLNGAFLSLSNAENGSVATLIVVVLLLVGATGVFRQLKDALNSVWHVEKKRDKSDSFIYKNILAVAIILLSAGLLIFSTLLAFLTSSIDSSITGFYGADHILFPLFNILLSVLISGFVIATIFTVFPSKKISFKKMLFPAFFTTFLLILLRILFNVYLNFRDVGALYGTAGSVLVFLLWIYFAAQVFLFGAEFSKLYSENKRGG